MKDINIVTVNYLGKDNVIECLSTLFSDIEDNGFEVQATVVDNSSNRDHIKEAMAERFPQAKYIDAGGNIGFGKGNNMGFKDTEARYYFALNPDMLIPKNKNVIGSLIKFMDENRKIACIGPKLLNLDGTLQDSCYRFDKKSILIKPLKQIDWDKKYKWVKKYTDKLLMKDFDHNETMPVDWVLGAAMVVRGEVIDKIGWFDDRYFMYLEDCDWCMRMWEEGMPVYYVHNIEMIHKYKRESSKVPGIFRALFKNKLARIHMTSWVKFIFKWRKKFKYYVS